MSNEREDPSVAAPPTPSDRDEADEDPLRRRRRETRIALGMEACPLCGRTHPARWERWQAVGRAQPGDLVGPVCAAKSPLMRNVYGTVWRILAVESISKHDYPRLLVEPVEPGPWADEGEEMRVEVDGSKVFPIEPR